MTIYQQLDMPNDEISTVQPGERVVYYWLKKERKKIWN